MTIDKKELFEKVKAYCEEQYAEIEKDFEYFPYVPKRRLVDNAAKRAYGVVMFVTNNLIGWDESLELTNWWNDDMNLRFWYKQLEFTE